LIRWWRCGAIEEVSLKYKRDQALTGFAGPYIGAGQ
jgi:hypothetical protein